MAGMEDETKATAALVDPTAQALSTSGPVGAQSPTQADPAKSVFINCPFDKGFEPAFHAIIFAVVACNFTPRSALESGTAETRIERIIQAIFSSRYSIHDLSRCRGEGEQQLARFNMPLELGMAIAHHYYSRNQPDRHDWAVLVPPDHVHVKVVSDLAGFDLLQYDGTPEAVVRKVMSWLVTRTKASRKLSPKMVLDVLPTFMSEIAQLKEHWGDEPIWADIVEAAERTAPKL